MTNVICCCAWTGDLRSYDPCPACARSYTYRVTAKRLDALRAVKALSNAALEPAMRSSLLRLGMMVLASGRTRPNHGRRHTTYQRRHIVTDDGERVIAVATGIIADQSRHDIAASVVRHSEMNVPCVLHGGTLTDSGCTGREPDDDA